MFKLVVLCAFLAAAVAEPGVITSVPVTYSAAAVAPLTTSYVNPLSSVYPSAVTYSAPYGLPHFIKKRAVPVTYSSYVAPTYVSSPLATTYGAPYVSAASYYPTGPVAYTTAAHLIKKRAAVIPNTYVAPTAYASAPYVASTYAAGPVYTTPYVSAAPVYTPHFIKKRSVVPVAVNSYVAPTSYSSQTRVDYSAPLVHSYAAASPVAYTAPFGAPVTHFV